MSSLDLGYPAKYGGGDVWVPPGSHQDPNSPRDPSESRGCLRYRVSQMMLMICGPSAFSS